MSVPNRLCPLSIILLLTINDSRYYLRRFCYRRPPPPEHHNAAVGEADRKVSWNVALPAFVRRRFYYINTYSTSIIIRHVSSAATKTIKIPNRVNSYVEATNFRSQHFVFIRNH